MSFLSEAVFNEHRYSHGQTKGWFGVVLNCLLSTVCGDLLVAFEDIWSRRVVLHRLLSTVCDDLLVVFEDIWS